MYFIKSNTRLEENATFSRLMDRLIFAFPKSDGDEISKSDQEINRILKEPLADNRQFNQFRNSDNSFKYKTLRDYLRDKKIGVFDSDGNPIYEPKTIDSLLQFYDKFKTYQSFKGKVDFTQYFSLLDFEPYIYYDKIHKYRETFAHNKRIIPDFMAAIFASMIQQGHINFEIRRILEQYVIALMVNKDYKNYATFSQLQADFEHLKLGAEKIRENYVYIWTGSPAIFSDEEKKSLIISRLDAFKNSPFYHDQAFIQNSHIELAESSMSKNGKAKIEGIDISIKVSQQHTTQNELETLLETIGQDFRGKNLIVFTSTFLLVKLAKEIERFYYSSPSCRPDNVILIGDEAFFKLIKRPDGKNELLMLKKMKSLFFEMFLHSLDKNSRN